MQRLVLRPRRSMLTTAQCGALQFLEQLKDHERLGVPKDAGIDTSRGFDLGRMRRLVSGLGDPLKSFPVVHVAGTKGKGSTVAFFSNTLRAAGYCVGTYTSPHLRSIRERIAVGSPVSQEGFEDLFESVRKPLMRAMASEDWKLTHFEVLTALAFKYFEQRNVDIAVIETGLGGARDATNVVEPEGLAAAVITSIGKEHLEALGGSLETVALAKAGIIKQGRPVVLSRQPHEVAEDILYRHAAEKSAPVIKASGSLARGVVKNFDKNAMVQICDFKIHPGFQLQNGKCLQKAFNLEGCKVHMFGAHQVDNALTSLCTALCLREEGWNIPDSALRSGLENTVLPGRFHVLSREEVSALVSSELPVVVDGAHTGGSAAALAATLRSLFPTELLVLIVAMASDKDHHAFASALLETKPAAVCLTRVDVAGGSLRTASQESLRDAWAAASQHKSSGVTIVATDSLKSALKEAENFLRNDRATGVICITGSLHAVSAALDLCSS